MLRDVERLFREPGSALYTIAMKGRGAKPRPEQAAYALDVARCILSDGGPAPSIGLLQAGTGIGKSLGYLVPAMMHAARTGARVVIATHTIALQKQIMDLTPGVQEMILATEKKFLKAARRIGRRNFLSPAQLAAFIEQQKRIDASVPALPVAERILAAMLDDADMTTIQAVTEHFGRDIRDAGGLWFSLESCRIGQHEGDDAIFEAMVANSRDADVLVVNHALLALDVMSGGRILSDPEDERETIYLVDEADALPDVIKSLLSRRLPLSVLRRLVESIKQSGIAGWKTMRKHLDVLDALEAQAREQFSSHRFSGSDRNVEVIPIIASVPADWRRDLHATLLALNTAFKALDSRSHQLGIHEDLAEARMDLDAILNGLDEVDQGDQPWLTPAIYWTPARKQPGLLVTGGAPEIITSNLWRKQTMRARSIVFTSATLSGTTDEFGFPSMIDFAIRVGMGNAVRERAIVGNHAPHHFATMDFVIVDQGEAPSHTIPRPKGPVFGDEDEDDSPLTNPVAVKWWVGMIKAAAKENNGSILVLPTSYKNAELIAAELGDLPGWEIILDAPGSSDAVMRFKDAKKAILIAPGRWAGLDLPGKIRHIVIPSLPFAPPEIIHNESFERYIRLQRQLAEKRLLDKAISGARVPANIAQAKRKVEQALGRGTRSVDDVVTIWIGDRRWPSTKSRNDSGRPPLVLSSAARGMASAVPLRFRKALDDADGFTLERGRFKYKRAVVRRRAHDLVLE